jgi:DNA-binding transcriptional ArsR family regulator
LTTTDIEPPRLDPFGAVGEGRLIAIRFELADDSDAALAFGYSPLLETLLSLHVLVEPKHHALQHSWVRAMRRLDPPLRREIAALSFLYRWTLPNCVLPSATTGYDDIETEVERLRALRRDVVAFELLRPLYDHGGGRRPARRRILADQRVRDLALRRARRLGPEAHRAAALLFDDPRALVERLTGLLESYWEAAFADEWRRIEPRLAEGVGEAGRRIAADGVHRFLLSLAPQLRIDPEGSTFGLDVPHDHHVRVTPERPLLLVPSVYVWPHVRVNCDRPWPLVLVYRAPHVLDDLRPSSALELVHAFRALGDPTRLRILRLIAARPRSTQELAPIVGLTDAGTSKHLRQLTAAGLLETRREGYYVLYSLVPDRLDSLASELRRVTS